MLKFTGNPKGVRVGILLLLVAFAAGALGYCKKSAAAEGLSIGFGIATAGGEPCFDSMLLAQELGERRWLAFLMTHGESSSCRDNEPIRANVGAGVMRTTQLGRWSIGFGAGAFEHGDVVVGPGTIVDLPAPRTADRTQFCAILGARRYLFNERAALDWVHCSTGGSTHYNRGLNSFTLSARF